MKVLSNGQWVDWASNDSAQPERRVNPSSSVFKWSNTAQLIVELGDAVLSDSNITYPAEGVRGSYLFLNMPITRLDNPPSKIVGNTVKMFSGCNVLQSIGPMDTSGISSMSSMFYSCKSLVKVPEIDVSSVTDTESMFSYCEALTSVPSFVLDNVIRLTAMFQGCLSLKTINMTGKPLATDMTNMFSGCSSLVEAPPIDMSNITNSNSMFSGCTSLTKVGVFNFTRSLAVSGAKLDVAAINTLFTNAGTAYNSSQTIDVRSNPGSAGCDPTIATAKGWTVLR